jgi:acyl carrier protein
MNSEKSIHDQVIDITAKFVDESLSPERIRLETTTDFSQLGLNSVTFTHFLIALEKEFGFEFEDEKLLMKNHKNLEELIAYIKTKINSTNPG